MTTYSMETQLGKGQERETFLDCHFVEVFEITPATRDEQRLGIDRIFKHRQTGKVEKVEYKADFKAQYTHNAFIETVSVDNQQKRGWAWTTKADKVFYYVEGDSLVYVLEPSRIRELLPQWLKQYPIRKANNGTYWTHGVCVPLAELEACAVEVVSL